MSQFKVKPRLPADAVEGFAAKADETKKPVTGNDSETAASPEVVPNPSPVAPVRSVSVPAVDLAILDPNAKPTKGLRLDLNEWQLEALRQIAQRDERSMQYVLQKLLKAWIPQELAKKG